VASKLKPREIIYGKTMEEMEEEYSKDPDKECDERLAIILYKYRDVLDASYHLLLSESNELEELMEFAPEFFIISCPRPIPNMARLFDVDETAFLDLLERNRHFVNFFMWNHASPSVGLNRHLCDFLSDRNRARAHYRDLKPHRHAICLKLYELVFGHPWPDIANMCVFCIRVPDLFIFWYNEL
jgi:hypothetical protein